MVRSALCLFTICLILSCFSVSWAQESSDNTEAGADSDLVFFSDPLTFNQSCEDLAFEDFDDTNIDPDSEISCPGPFNSLTDNGCYSDGALVEGFSLSVLEGKMFDLAVITAPLFGLITTAAGPDTLKDGTEINFDPPQSGVGLSIVTPLSSGILTVEIYSTDDALLGSTDLIMEENSEGEFLGVTTQDRISRIVLNNNGQNLGELLYEIQFGDCGISLGDPNTTTIVPTLSEWGLTAMAGVLGVVGFMVMRRRTASAGI